jgi:hypothetical protein
VTISLKKFIKRLKELYKIYITSELVRILNRKPLEYSNKSLEKVFSDFWRLYNTPRLAGKLYILTFIDNYTWKS